MVIALAILRSFYKKNVKMLSATFATETEKFATYKKTLLKFYTGLEIVAMLGIMAFLFQGHYNHLIISLIVLVEMFLSMPTESKLNSYVFNTSNSNL
jgi:hypothetical protein